jgi:hypothetical protein
MSDPAKRFKWYASYIHIMAASSYFKDAPEQLKFKDPGQEVLMMEACQAVEKRLRPSVDAIMRVWIRSGGWPEISPNESFFVKKRLDWAFDIAQALLASKESGGDPIFPNPPESFGDEDRLEWFLIHAWASIGHQVWFREIRKQWGTQFVPHEWIGNPDAEPEG